MAQVLDYSGGFPGAQAIKDAGYAGAVRYIGFPKNAKCTTAGELADFTAHGLGMALVYEHTAGDWRGGHDAGVAAGAGARGHAHAISFPDDRPIYAAIDQDVVTPAEFDTVIAYLTGFATANGGPALAGVYGEADVIDRARAAGVVAWFWQTKAWSRGRVTTAHLLQLIGTVNVGGVGCDINNVLAQDWGQQTGVDMTPDEGYNLLATFFKDVATAKAPDVQKLWHDYISGSAWDGVSGFFKDVGGDPDVKIALHNIISEVIAPLKADIAELKGRPVATATVDAHQLAAELISQGLASGATQEQVAEAIRQAFAKAATP